LRQLALHPENDLIDAEDAHFRDCGAKALAGLDQLGGFLKLALGEGAFAQHHFAEAVLAVAAGGEDELAAVEKQVALNAAENELKLAGEARGVNFVEQSEKLVVRLDFARVERQRATLEPTQGSRYGFETGFLGKLLDKAVEAGAIFRSHVYELHAHAVAGASMPDNAARAHFAASYVEK
jgi:hypothetical protein